MSLCANLLFFNNSIAQSNQCEQFEKQELYTNAATCYLEVAEEKKANNDLLMAIELQLKAANCFSKNTEYNKEQRILRKASKLALDNNVESIIFKIEYLRSLNYSMLNQPKRSLQIVDSMIIKCNDSSEANYYYYPLGKALYYNEIDEHKKVFPLLNKAEAMFLKTGLKTDNDYITILENRAEAFHGFGDRHSKIAIYRKVAHLRAKNQDWYQYMYATYHIAHSFDELKVIDSAIFYYNQAQQIAKKHKVGQNFIGMYKGLPYLYVNKGELEKANIEVEKLIIAIDNNTGNDAATINNRSSGFSNIGYYYSALNEIDKAILYFTKAIKELKKLESKPQSLSGLYGAKGRHYTAIGNFDKGVEVLKRQLYMFCIDSKIDSNIWPTHNQMIPKLYSVSAYFNMAETFYRKAKTSESFEPEALKNCVYLTHQALLLNDRALSLVTNLKTRLYYLSKLDLYFNMYLTSIDDLKSNGENVDQEIIDALILFNKYKEGILRTKLQVESLSGDGAKPYQRLIAMQNDFNQIYYKAEKSTDELHRIDSLQNAITTISTDLVAKNPDQFNLIYGAKDLDLKAIQQKLSANEVIYFYQVVYNNIYRFDIFKDSIDLFLSYKVDELQQLATELHAAMTTNNVGKYANLAYALFRELDIDTQFTNIYIVSSNMASTVPFDALLYQQADDTLSFKNLPYLFLNNNISGLSYLENFKNNQSKKQLEFDSYVAFAPSFSLSHKTDFLAVRAANRDLLVDIPGAIEEITSSAEYFTSSTLFLKENATEASFKQNGQKANILHFATHAFVDLNNPLNSHLVLADKDTLTEDGILYAHELMGLNLNAELAILSACNTGVGKPENIEGAQNLAYAFAFSGVKNVLVTLWNTADASAPVIVNSFLKNVSEGQSLGNALSNAKKQYITEADDLLANPYYWANFSLQGNPNDVIVSEKNNFTLLAMIFTAVIALLTFIVYKFKK